MCMDNSCAFQQIAKVQFRGLSLGLRVEDDEMQLEAGKVSVAVPQHELKQFLQEELLHGTGGVNLISFVCC